MDTYYFSNELLNEPNWTRLNDTYILPLSKCAEYTKAANMFYDAVRNRNMWEIEDITLVWNKSIQRGFEVERKTLENRMGDPVFLPKWHQMDHSEYRRDIMRELYYNVHKQNPDNKGDLSKGFGGSVLPLWHGTRKDIAFKIINLGFASLQLTDIGFFGKGLYATNSAEYALNVYSKPDDSGHKCVILCWGIIGNPFPVTSADIKKLQGMGHYQNYDTHYIPVKPQTKNPTETVYIPCDKISDIVYEEFVVFNHLHLLPRYIFNVKPIKNIVPHTPNINGHHNSNNFSVYTDNNSNKSIDDLSTNSWSSAQVCSWLNTLNLSKDYRNIFTKKNIDGIALKNITEKYLSDIGISALGDRRKIVWATHKLK
jgi:hypothetical protein